MLMNEEEQNYDLVKVNADNDSKQHVLIQWISFIVLTSTIFLCSLGLPDTFIQKGINPCEGDELISISNFTCTDLGVIQGSATHKYQGLLIKEFESANLFIMVHGRLYLHAGSESKMKIEYNYTFNMFTLNQKGSQYEKDIEVYHKKEHKQVVTCNQKIKNDSYLVCDATLLAYVRNIDSDYSNIFIRIDVNSNEKLGDRILDFQLVAHSAASAFTYSIIIIRYVFLAISILSCSLYFYKYKMLQENKLIIEQKLVLGLSFLVILYDDPLTAITLLIPNNFTLVLGIIFMANFVVALLLFWMIVIQRMNNNGQTNGVTIYKIIIAILVWLTIVISYCIVQLNFHNDPSNSYEDYDSDTFLAFKIMSFIFGIIGLGYLVYQHGVYCKQYQSRLWRYKVQGMFSLYFILAYVLFLFTGTYEYNNFDGSRILLTISVLNLYIYYMQYLWSPSVEGIMENNQLEQAEMNIYNQEQNQVYDVLDEDNQEIKVSFEQEQE